MERFGTPVAGLRPLGLTHLFPSASVLATADLRGVGLPPESAERIRGFAAMVAEGAIRFDRTKGLDHLLESLTTIACLDHGTANYLALRMGEPDAFPAGDPRIRSALSDDPERPLAPGTLESTAESWRPWRAHAAAQLMR